MLTALPFSFFLILLIYFISGCAGSSLLRGLFSCCGKWGLSFACLGFSLCWLLLLQSTGSRRVGFINRGTRAPWSRHVSSRAQARACGTRAWWSRHVGSRACGMRARWSRHAGSSWTRDRICVSLIGRQILHTLVFCSPVFSGLNNQALGLWRGGDKALCVAIILGLGTGFTEVLLNEQKSVK